MIPARDEAGSIRETVEGVTRTLAREHIDYEVIVVDDASNDATGDVVVELGRDNERIRYARSPYPRGFGLPFEADSSFHR